MGKILKKYQLNSVQKLNNKKNEEIWLLPKGAGALNEKRHNKGGQKSKNLTHPVRIRAQQVRIWAQPS